MRFLFLLLLASYSLFAQQSDQQKAYRYYVGGEYQNAIEIYKELTSVSYSGSYFTPYYNSLLELELYKDANAIAKSFSNSNSRNLQYKIAQIIALKKSGNSNRSNFLYSKLINKINGVRSQAISSASFFARYEFYNEALEIYRLAEKLNPNNFFGMQKASIYSKNGDIELMLKEYLLVMEKNSEQSQFITSKIQKFVDNNGIWSNKNYDLIKKLLLVKVRDEKNRADFTEMLIWLFMQNNEYKMALIQAKAFDKRTKSNGEMVYNLASTFLDKEEFSLAIEAYNYIISKGKNNVLFVDSNINRLFALTKKSSFSTNDYNAINIQYENIIHELGANKETVILFTNYAHFKAFYEYDLDIADSLLNAAMLIKGINSFDLAECKMEYADILLLKGNIWESMLYYSQVEKDFKEDPIGHEAKLRRAKISYFQGDFRWAQAQLETLKASTSKLIANNAMEISLLITDNFNLDTTEISMQTFARADLLKYQQKYDLAILKYDSVLNIFPGHSLTDEIYMRKADIYIKLKQPEKALNCYEKIDDGWSSDILADDALFKSAKIYDDLLSDDALALQLYNKILEDYNSSIFVAESRRRIRELTK